MAWALLVMYVIALGHQVVPHDHGLHSSGGDECPFCLLLTLVAVASAVVLLASGYGQLLVSLSTCAAAPHTKRVCTPYCLRGPPFLR
ncbi:MAG TPA: hypothetical protein PLO37_05875 [Candidatus Hydrogenedentes bacterium]|nr:hypothetical protein [Candidatus Hydrogenedentota bacterium]HPG66357.1 hypothetical protein [Candidatus Hydrogenedentota bacterium]